MMKLIKTFHSFLMRGTFSYSRYLDSDTKPETDLKWLLFLGYLNQLPYLKVFFFTFFLITWLCGISTMVILRYLYEFWTKKERVKHERH